MRKTCHAGGVEITEQALRELLNSAHGPRCGQSIMDAVANGEPLLLTTADGKKVTLSSLPETRTFLHDRFGWTADAVA
jgi:hypothetical protein